MSSLPKLTENFVILDSEHFERLKSRLQLSECFEGNKCRLCEQVTSAETCNKLQVSLVYHSQKYTPAKTYVKNRIISLLIHLRWEKENYKLSWNKETHYMMAKYEIVILAHCYNNKKNRNPTVPRTYLKKNSQQCREFLRQD